jgi:hypothetical protein
MTCYFGRRKKPGTGTGSGVAEISHPLPPISRREYALPVA